MRTEFGSETHGDALVWEEGKKRKSKIPSPPLRYIRSGHLPRFVIRELPEMADAGLAVEAVRVT